MFENCHILVTSKNRRALFSRPRSRMFSFFLFQYQGRVTQDPESLNSQQNVLKKKKKGVKKNTLFFPEYLCKLYLNLPHYIVVVVVFFLGGGHSAPATCHGLRPNLSLHLTHNLITIFNICIGVLVNRPRISYFCLFCAIRAIPEFQ